MLSTKIKKKYYAALLRKDRDFDGISYVGVKSTGVFCRSICPARKPLFENCEFFEKGEEALLAGFRPCKRCKPLSHPHEIPEVVRTLLKAIEEDPEKKWKEEDFQKLEIHAAQAARLFKKRFGMTFVAYARARRMGIALKEIKGEKSVIETQLEVGYHSSSGFRDAFSKIMGNPPVKAEKVKLLVAEWLDTPLGPMLAISDEESLYLLEFVSRRGLEKEIEKLRKKIKAAIIPGRSKPLRLIKQELTFYFEGKLKNFKTPIQMLGSPFQKKVWNHLLKIPYGETRSYTEIAEATGHPNAVRAVGSANGANQLALIIPCHRVIKNDGQLGGYGGGLERKRYVLQLEKENLSEKEEDFILMKKKHKFLRET